MHLVFSRVQMGHGSDDDADGTAASLGRALKQSAAERQRFEEDNFVRLTVSKEERLKRKAYAKEKRRFDPLSNLTAGFDGLDRLTGDGGACAVTPVRLYGVAGSRGRV